MRKFICLSLLLVSAPVLAQPTLLVGNKGEDTVSFIDLSDGRERMRVPTGKMPHEIAMSPDGKRAAVVAYGDKTIDIFEVANGKMMRRIDLAPNLRPHGIVWLADGRIVATTEGTQSLVQLSPDFAQMDSIATAQQGSHMVATDPAGSVAYVANIGSGSVSVIDLKARKKLADIAVGARPEAIALSQDAKTLWVGDLAAPVVHIVDVDSRKVTGTINVEPVAIRLLLSPDGTKLVSSNVAAGSISVIDTANAKVERTIKVSGEQAAGQVTLLFSNDGRKLYAAETGRDKVAEIDFVTGNVIRRFDVGKNGDGLAIAP
jgi:YVTN family beta-propeller protein